MADLCTCRNWAVPHAPIPSCPLDGPPAEPEVRVHLGTYLAVPEAPAQEAALRLRELGHVALADVLSGAVRYEPDNHHNAALCPYCNGNR